MKCRPGRSAVEVQQGNSSWSEWSSVGIQWMDSSENWSHMHDSWQVTKWQVQMTESRSQFIQNWGEVQSPVWSQKPVKPESKWSQSRKWGPGEVQKLESSWHGTEEMRGQRPACRIQVTQHDQRMKKSGKMRAGGDRSMNRKKCSERSENQYKFTKTILF